VATPAWRRFRRAMLRPRRFSHRKLKPPAASARDIASPCPDVASPMVRIGTELLAPQRENRSDSQRLENVRALRCRWCMRNPRTRAQFARFPGESLKPETGRRMKQSGSKPSLRSNSLINRENTGNLFDLRADQV